MEPLKALVIVMPLRSLSKCSYELVDSCARRDDRAAALSDSRDFAQFHGFKRQLWLTRQSSARKRQHSKAHIVNPSNRQAIEIGVVAANELP